MATPRASSARSATRAGRRQGLDPNAGPPDAPPPDDTAAASPAGPLTPLTRRTRSTAEKESPFTALLCIVAFVALVCFFLYSAVQGKDTAIGLVLVPVLVLALSPWLSRLAKAEPGFKLLPIMVLGLLLRYLAAFFRLENAADAIYYHRSGMLLAPEFRSLNFAVDTKGEIPGTGTVRYVSGLISVFTGSSIFAEFLVFTTFAFIGVVFFYKAFTTALPNGDHRRYALLIFLWPSMAYWPSSVGKEAIMTFTVGLASYGAARLFQHQRGGILMLGFGVWATLMVRPHIALTILIAVFLGFVFARRSSNSAATAAGKIMAVFVVIIVGGLVMGRTATFLDVENLDGGGIESALETTTDQTSQGGSEFSPMKADNPARFPGAIVTVLFRPFPTEAHNFESFGTSFEGFVLLALIVTSWSRLRQLPRALLREPYVMYAMSGMLLFCFLFSYVANFGILARQRTQILPLLFVLIAFIPKPERKGRSNDDAPDDDARATRRMSMIRGPVPPPIER